jgi:hypothetical protein
VSPLLRPLHTYKKPIPVRKGWVIDGVGYIPLTTGLLAIVDPSWVPVLEQWNWFAALDAKSGQHYAKRWSSRSLGPRKHIHMACVVSGVENDSLGVMPDHINRNKLDNRFSNLRRATPVENLRNKGVQKDNASGLKGVHYSKRFDRYDACIKVDGKSKYLGRRRTAQEAHELWCEAARKLHGEFYCAA